ncbi:hypothetical protein MKW94_016416 [Papaver nudicaule]|uniref:Uncharacterized protein n=1 Tax=Papaver nudicaule TaxID=74823 RepID=A0AA41RY78_PAPNU|nr:hypothetical protein [Papaver nudicaule]
MEGKEDFIDRRSLRIQELIKTSMEHDRVPYPPRRSPQIEEQARIREKMEMKIERQRQRRHEMDPHQKANQLQQRRILERAKQSLMTIQEWEAFCEKRRNQQ